MSMIYNVHYEVAALVFLVVIYAFFEIQYASNTESARYFRKVSILMIIDTSLDVITAITIGYAKIVPRGINIFLNMLYFLLSVFLLYHYVLYICSFFQKDPSPLNRKINTVIAWSYAGLQVVNLFTGITFYFTPEGEYKHGPLFLLTYGVAFYFVLDGLYIAVRKRKEITRRHLYAVIFFTITEVTGLFLQMVFFPHVLLSFFGVTVALTVMMFSLETPDYKRLLKTLEELEQNRSALEKMTESAEQARKDAEDANQAKSAFLASMSHEIRTPINGVLGMNTMILRESDDPKILEYASNIESAGNGLLSIINDILDLTKIESGRMEIIPAEYEFSNILSSCYNMVCMRAQEKGLDLVFENNPMIPNRLFGDEVRIRQIIVNLLTNAIKYTEEGMVVLTADFRRLSKTEIMLIISVKDTGSGIEDENLGKLFKAFERLDEVRHRSVEGTGLGLKLTKQFLDLMGGTIEVESVVGRGSEFRIRLNQIVCGEEMIGDSSYYVKAHSKDKDRVLEFTAPEARILVVDDVEMNIKVIEGLLSGASMQIDRALSGAEGLKKIRETEYDIIFLDHMMPRMSGIEMYAEMKKEGSGFTPGTPVIMLTANAILGAKEEYLQEGFTDYLSKPVNETELVEMVLRYLPKEKVHLGEPRADRKEAASGKEERDAKKEADPEVLDSLSRQEKALYAAAKAGRIDAVEARHESFRKLYQDLMKQNPPE
ncbi:MAG: response regulator [Lachnospiraceae bacterium]|nr:response regulator [Lachnospiraceae bacterium]